MRIVYVGPSPQGYGKTRRYPPLPRNRPHYLQQYGAMRDVRSSVGLVKGKSVMSSLGVPVVGSRLGGIPEIVDRYSAVAPPSPEKIEAVVKVLETHYDREEVMRYAFEKFGGGKERFLSWRG